MTANTGPAKGISPQMRIQSDIQPIPPATGRKRLNPANSASALTSPPRYPVRNTAVIPAESTNAIGTEMIGSTPKIAASPMSS